MSEIIKNKTEATDVMKGALAGLIGGLVAAFVMAEFQSVWSKVSGEKKQRNPNAKKEEPSTVKVAEMISENAFDHQLTKEEKGYAGPAMHYAMGGTSGAIYGAVNEMMPAVHMAAGLPFGAAVWVVADDIVLPALGLKKPPTEYPLSEHAYTLASHFVYGLTTEMVRGAVRNVL
jgi:uncharacterized membrane protein YagU involved in acid resistance